MGFIRSAKIKWYDLGMYVEISLWAIKFNGTFSLGE